MATTQQVRQSQLFAAEDWRVIYTAFTQVNFNAYDFNTIRSSMIDYVRINYPEDFNDWIESSEFVALIAMRHAMARRRERLLADRWIGGEHRNIRVNARRDRGIIARPDVAVGGESGSLAPHHHRNLGVGL